jgi:diguanylate cyclase
VGAPADAAQFSAPRKVWGGTVGAAVFGSNGSHCMTIRAQSGATADLATQIAALMRHMGVAGLPRNYELFYAATAGSNEELRSELSSLGQRPAQRDLDRLAEVHFAQNSGQSVVENAHDQIASKLEEVLTLVQKERSSLETYGRMLDETSDGLNGRNAISREILQKIVGIMVAATHSTAKQGRQTLEAIADHSHELEEVKAKLEEYKRLADTDPLTLLWNRRAFDRAIARIYDNPKAVMFHALLIADIDRFKEINDRFGHPAGDRVLQHLASILRSNTQENVFLARTGGEEFALIVDGASEDSVLQMADSIRAAVSATNFGVKAAIPGCAPMTISLGICMASEADGPSDLYAKADRALYSSKVNGRNRVTRHTEAIKANSGKNWFIYRKE